MKQLFITVALLISSLTIIAQEENIQVDNNGVSQKGSFSFHIGPTFPMSDFSNDDSDDFIYDDALGAGVGIGIGFKYIQPLNESGLGFFVGLDVNHNWIKEDVKDDIEDLFDDADNLEITYPKYFNVPLSGGIGYTINANEKVSIYGDIGMVINYFKMTNLTIEYDYDYYEEDYEDITEFDSAINIGVKIAGGLIINNKTYISINYFGIGKTDIDASWEETWEYDGITYEEDGDYDFKSKINYLTLTVGFKL